MMNKDFYNSLEFPSKRGPPSLELSREAGIFFPEGRRSPLPWKFLGKEVPASPEKELPHSYFPQIWGRRFSEIQWWITRSSTYGTRKEVGEAALPSKKGGIPEIIGFRKVIDQHSAIFGCYFLICKDKTFQFIINYYTWIIIGGGLSHIILMKKGEWSQQNNSSTIHWPVMYLKYICCSKYCF